MSDFDRNDAIREATLEDFSMEELFVLRSNAKVLSLGTKTRDDSTKNDDDDSTMLVSVTNDMMQKIIDHKKEKMRMKRLQLDLDRERFEVDKRRKLFEQEQESIDRAHQREMQSAHVNMMMSMMKMIREVASNEE